MDPKHQYIQVARFFLLFLLVYCCAILYLRWSCWRHPTSLFYQAERAHVPGYSAFRIAQAELFADEIAAAAAAAAVNYTETTPPPKICVAVSSVQRQGISYLKSTVGSLQQGLTPEERGALRFVVLLAHTDPSRHGDHGQPWLERMADRLPTYYQDDHDHDHDDADDHRHHDGGRSRLEQARALEALGEHNPKSVFDVSVVLGECVATGAEYVLLVEDDVVALDGWLHRTLAALDEVEAKTAGLGRTSFLYLRLFYYEALQGWNREQWPTYLGYSLAFAACEVLALWLLARRRRGGLLLTSRLSQLVLLGVCTPLCILLFFAAGPTCVLPAPARTSLMPKYACCGQGLVFPRDQVVDVVLPRFRAAPHDASALPVDSLIERIADEGGGVGDSGGGGGGGDGDGDQQLLRWALTPVVLQHVGGRSSHGAARDRFGARTPNAIFNFGFETNDPERLAEEHAAAAVEEAG
ncbi:hypothetical protein GGR56DRAFT_664859 [Xylariaceae sp. FL0804]|nr:hypothetical protein GGR56DRAFT_664859 [Xylariaceae sp. FL0804]